MISKTTKTQYLGSNVKHALILWTGLAVLFNYTNANAQQLVDISSCAKMTDNAKRYACYDNLAKQAGALPTPNTTSVPPSIDSAITPSVSTQPAAALASPPTNTSTSSINKPSITERIAAFGSSLARLEKEKSTGSEMLIDSITAVREYKPYILEVTLSSGQVWRQMIAKEFILRKGDEVQIVPNGWGQSFRLSATARNGFIQVERLEKH